MKQLVAEQLKNLLSDGKCVDLIRKATIAIEAGATDWEIYWYIALAAKETGQLDLVDKTCATVLEKNPQFWFARELPKHARGYYSQLGQDEIVERFFAEHPPKSRVFVEVGAFDGVHYSNVRRLRETHGWTGVSIEPVGKNYDKLSASYTGQPVICVRCAIGEKEGVAELNVSSYPHLPDWGSDVATLSESETKRWQQQYGAVWHKERVSVKTLTTVLRENHIETVDFLSVDAEGHDLDVLKGLDFSAYQPQLIVVEYNRHRQEIYDFLTENGYRLNHDNGQDLFMELARSSSGETLGRFETANIVNKEEPSIAPEYLNRINKTISCHDCDGIPKVPGAGQVMSATPPYQIMHNGIKILYKAFHGDWMSEIMRKLKGHHEPQEERVFHEVLKRIPDNATMIELGSFWSYYSMWFNQKITNARNFMIEPNPDKLELGKEHFRLNNMKGTFLRAFIGRTSLDNGTFEDWDHTVYELPQISIDDFMDANSIDFIHVLHSNIQGAEYEMLLGCQQTIAKGRIGYIFISTHGDCHEKCISFLKKQGFAIIATHTIEESFSADGLIVAASPHVPPMQPVRISKFGQQQEMLGNHSSLEQVLDKLNPHLLTLRTLPLDKSVQLATIDPKDLLTGSRFDIVPKLLYAEYRELRIDSLWARKVYEAHIHAFNGCQEGDGSGKSGIGAFIAAYNTLLDSIKAVGFDPTLSLVPVDRNGIVIDGAHRVAACIQYHRKINTVTFEMNANSYNYEFFLDKGLDQEYCDAVALEYCRLNPRSYIVSVFPSAVGNEQDVRSILEQHGEIFYARQVKLSRLGSVNLVRQMYDGEHWVGSFANRFEGAQHKAAECFRTEGPVRVYVFTSDDFDKVKAVKQQIRELFGISNHSVHVNDTHEETVRLGQLLLNANSVHFLNNARLTTFPRFQAHFENYKKVLREQRVDGERLCIDGSAVMAAYGIREARDLDYLHYGYDNLGFDYPPELIGSHNSEIAHHITTRDDIIFNPRNHFYYDGIKFASLGIIRALKQKRGETKDFEDVALIDKFVVSPLASPHVNESTASVTGSGQITVTEQQPKIVGLVPARNERHIIAQCLRALSLFTDAIIYLDDASTDETPAIVESLAHECRIERIIRKKDWHRDEPGDRNTMLKAGREIGGTHFIIIDADEMLTANLLVSQGLRSVIHRLQPGERLALNWIQLWRSVNQYRFDQSVWTWNYKDIIFCDDGQCFYSSEFIHTPRVPNNLVGNSYTLEGYEAGLLHFQFVNWRNLLIKQAWYRCLEHIREPGKPAADINKRYAPSKDENGLGLQQAPVSWFEGYLFFDHTVYDQPDEWRESQVQDWFEKYGESHFAELDIWDVTWGEGVKGAVDHLIPSSMQVLSYFQPPAGSMESFIDVRPLSAYPSTSSAYQALNDYPIRDFGTGLQAVERIIQHIFANKLRTPLQKREDFWLRSVVVKLHCKLADAHTGKPFAKLAEADLAHFRESFLAKEGAVRGKDILAYREQVLRGDELGLPLYISGAALNYLGAAVDPLAIFMIDGARRISALAIIPRQHLDINLIILEEEFCNHFLDSTRRDGLQNNIAQLTWFNNYQSIPLVGLKGHRTLKRFELMDMGLLCGQNIMDFGCNLGQACIKAVMAGAREVWGVEGMPDTYGLASEISQLSGFPNLHYLNIDFNNAEFSQQIDAACPGQVDYSFFFSVYRTKELTQRDVLFRYIIQKSRKGIFFEGHADPKIDSLEYYNWLFESFGLTAQYLGNSEGELRPLFFIPLADKLTTIPPSPTTPASIVGKSSSQAQSPFRVSAIVSTYKSERFIEGRLKDLLGQSLGDKLEIIVVDSNSPENERVIVERYAAKNSNIVYIRTEQRETVYQAWNRGVKAARGSYITNANADDRLRSDALEMMANELDQHPEIALVYADFFITGYENMCFDSHIRTGYSIKPDYSSSIMLHGCHMGPQPMWRKSLHDDLGYFDEQLTAAGDYEFWCRIACKYSMRHLPEFLGLYLHNPVGICNSNTRRAADESELVKSKYRCLLPLPASDLPTGFYYKDAVTSGRYVNICMITFNRLEFTRQSIEALLIHTDFPYVLSVIDNGSTDGTREYLQEQMRNGIIKNLVLPDENVGVARASNLAWSLEPAADYYLKLDNDIVIQKSGWLTSMVNTVDEVDKIGAVAYNFEPVSYPLHTLGRVQIRPKLDGNLGGACMLIPRRTWEQLGYWCEDYGLYGEEDADYGYRISLAKLLNCYMPDEEIGVHLPAGRAAVIDRKSYAAMDGIEEHDHADYRKWKDEQRRNTMTSGIYFRNIALYDSGDKPLFCDSIFAKEYFNHQQESVQIPVSKDSWATGPTKASTPLRIVVYSLDKPHHAAPRIRLIYPAQALSDRIELRWGMTCTDGDQHCIDTSLADWADIVVVQRLFPLPQTWQYIEQILAKGKPVIYESDDLLVEIPESNMHQGDTILAAQYICDLAKRAKAVSVSTEPLAKFWRAQGVNAKVIPNVLNQLVWQRPVASGSGPIIIGYAGTPSHLADLSLLEEALFRIAGEHGNLVEFHFYGCVTDKLARLPQSRVIPFEDDYEAYAALLQNSRMDIALSPLADNRFNRCKSNIKWLEYSACGIPGIFSDLPPYSSCVEQGKTGLLVENCSDKWFMAMDVLIKNSPLRASIATQARVHVLQNFTLATGAQRFMDVFSSFKASSVTQGILCSIIIPVFNKHDYTRRCLDTIFDVTPTTIAFEVIVVDNGSTDETSQVLDNLGDKIRVVRNKDNLGFARACNQGAASARGEYLLFLNNDTEPRPGWLEPLVKVLKSDSSVGAVGSKLLFPDGTIQHAGVVVVEDRQLPDPLVARHIYYQQPADFEQASTAKTYQALTAACIMVRRAAFEKINGFDEAYWNGYEDVDLCFKLGQEGWKLVYQPFSIVVHHESKSGKERFSQVSSNIQRLHQRWLGIIKPDIIVDEQGTPHKGPGNTTGFLAEYNVLSSTGVKEASSPKVSIIIPVFNKIEYTRQCIESLLRNSGATYHYEIIIVDNASTDDTREYLSSLDGVIRSIVNSENLGFACACNRGAEAARGEFLVFLNNDTVPQPGWLNGLLRGAVEDRADIVGAKLLYPDGTIQHAGVTFVEPGDGVHIFKGLDGSHRAANRKRFLQCVTGACLLITRELFLQLGGFDEAFRNGYEDVDFCLRARELGKSILYTPESVLTHYEETTEGRKAHDDYNREMFIARWSGRMQYDTLAVYKEEGFLQPIGDDRADILFNNLGVNNHAVFIYSSVLERNPCDTGALLNLARLYLKLNRPDEAALFLGRLLEIAPEHTAAMSLSATLHLSVH